MPDREIAQVLLEYCHAPAVRDQFAADTTSDAMTDFTAKGWFDKVWGLVGTVPESVYRPLLSYMPTEVLQTWEVPDVVVKRMSDDDLAHLVQRSDAKLPRLRKRIEENPEQFPEKVLAAAGEWEQWMPRPDDMTELRQRLATIVATLQAIAQKKRTLFG